MPSPRIGGDYQANNIPPVQDALVYSGDDDDGGVRVDMAQEEAMRISSEKHERHVRVTTRKRRRRR